MTSMDRIHRNYHALCKSTMSEKFNLKWNDFQTNVSKSFGLLRNEDYLHDVTLISEDFKHIQAHKLVLTACSDFFKNILKETKQSQPLLCLDGVNFIDLQNVLDYVYLGEVRILQEDLDRFLLVAQKLKLEGLMADGNDDTENFHNEQTIYKDDIPFENDVVKNAMLFRETDTNIINKTIKRHQSKPIQKESKVVIPVNWSQDNQTIDIMEKVDENISRNADKTNTCKICGKLSRPGEGIGNMKRHVETHFEGLTYTCNICEKTFRSSNSLKSHQSHQHK